TIVKLVVLGKSTEQLARDVDRLRRFDVRCVAECVESASMRATCAALGFDLFQGYFFARPETLHSREIPVGSTNLIRLLNMLREQGNSDALLEEVFRSDLALTHKLLHMVNCAGTGHSGVSSIGHGIRLLGRSTLHRWMALLLVSSLSAAPGSARDELVEMAMIRARFCELLMQASGRQRESEASFVAGLLSLLDSLLQVAMPELVRRLHLAPEIEQALLAREGPHAPTLRIAEAYESARWSELFSTADSAGIVVDDLPDAYVRAVEWARRCRAEIV
ncbi:MAG: EAL and HDOD domain-containing protein, partial [bacterium]